MRTRSLPLRTLGVPLLACALAGTAPAQQESTPPVSSGADTTAAVEVAPEPTPTPAPLNLQVQPEPRKRPSFPKLLVKDIGHVVTKPFHWRGKDVLLAFGALAAAGAPVAWDGEISDDARENWPDLGVAEEFFHAMGNEYSVGVPVIFMLTGWISGDQKAKDVGQDTLLAIAVGDGLVNSALATFPGRSRPYRGKGPYDFHPGINTDFDIRSLPSGHTAEAFSICSVIATSYDQLWVKVLSYAVGAGVAYDRVRTGKHYLSDVILGAAIGTATGQTIVRYNRKLRYGPDPVPERRARFVVMPMVDGKAYGLTGVLVF